MTKPSVFSGADTDQPPSRESAVVAATATDRVVAGFPSITEGAGLTVEASDAIAAPF